MGHPEIRLLYVTPETLFSNKHRDVFMKAHEQNQLRRLVVDEVGDLIQLAIGIQLTDPPYQKAHIIGVIPCLELLSREANERTGMGYDLPTGPSDVHQKP